jgi:hypothetical protein
MANMFTEMQQAGKGAISGDGGVLGKLKQAGGAKKPDTTIMKVAPKGPKGTSGKRHNMSIMPVSPKVKKAVKKTSY